MMAVKDVEVVLYSIVSTTISSLGLFFIILINPV